MFNYHFIDYHFIDDKLVPDEYFDTLSQFTKYDFTELNEIPDNPDDEDKDKLEVDGD